MSLISKIKKFRNRKFNDDVYLIYSMGKVGSSSVESSLIKRLPDAVIFHPHFLSDRWLDEILPLQNEFFHGNIRIGKKIRNYLASNPAKKIKIITLVREPLIREMSGIFENWQAFYKDIEKVELAVLEERMNKSDFSFCFNWFDTEFKEFTGFDIFSADFNKEKGFSIYKTEKFEILCLQLEKLEEVFSEAMNQFLNLNIALFNSNISEDKKGHELYRQLKDMYRIDPHRADFIYNSRFMTHFYSEKTLVEFRKKWTKLC